MSADKKPASRIPVKAVKDTVEKYGMRTGVLFCWDGATEHVVTYGVSVEDCDLAARGGDKLKKALGWPINPNTAPEPSRVKQLRAEVASLKTEVARLQKHMDAIASVAPPI